MSNIHKTIKTRSSIYHNTREIGEPLERKLERLVNNNEPIGESLEPIYLDRKDGVKPSYDIRTDRFEVAVEAMDKVSGSRLAKREEKGKIVELNKVESTNTGTSNTELNK